MIQMIKKQDNKMAHMRKRTWTNEDLFSGFKKMETKVQIATEIKIQEKKKIKRKKKTIYFS